MTEDNKSDIPSSPHLAQYIIARLRTTSFFMFSAGSVPIMMAAAELSNVEGLPEKFQTLFRDASQIWEKFSKDHSPSSFNHLRNEMFHCRNIEAFQHYLSSMLMEVYINRPETMRSSEMIQIEEVLRHGNMTELIYRLAERKINNLSYRGFNEMFSYLKESLGLAISPDQETISTIREAIEVRNIIVHNGCVINSMFLRKTGRQDLSEGDPFPLSLDYVQSSGAIIKDFLEEIDELFICHFGLEFHNISTDA
jgi:hypothetical protein